MIRLWVSACALLLLAGCVTESTTSRAPASKEVQLQAHLDLARGYLEQGDAVRARDPLERALQIDPRSAEAQTLMGIFYQGQNEPALAERHFKRALQINANHAQTLNNYGTFLYGQGRYQEALVPLRRLTRDPEYRGRAQAFENLGLAELVVGNTREAKDAFERALTFNGQLPRSNLELAQLSFDLGDYEAANRFYDAFRSRARQTPSSLCLGIRIAHQAGDEDRRASYEIALRNLHPDSGEATRCASEG
jgi:type IV pilus assembly protein PilF